jgi:hypothetical protein
MGRLETIESCILIIRCADAEAALPERMVEKQRSPDTESSNGGNKGSDFVTLPFSSEQNSVESTKSSGITTYSSWRLGMNLYCS